MNMEIMSVAGASACSGARCVPRCVARCVGLLLFPCFLASLGGCGESDSLTETEVERVVTGTLEVTTSTVAGGLDADGFVVSVDGTLNATIGTDGTATIVKLASGDHELELTGLATGCSVTGDNPRNVSIPADDTARVTFEARCGLRDQIVFSSYDGSFREIWVMGADGSNPRLLFGRDGVDVQQPAVSPDGSLVAFASERSSDLYDVWVMEADGSHPTNLTPGASGVHWQPTFSPDGTSIAFTSSRDGDSEIFVMGADGSDPRPLTRNDAIDQYPTWSPDGARIAFVSSRVGSREIFVMPVDGSDPPVRLTNNATLEFEPAWSPDGRRIAFHSTVSLQSDIHQICADGRTRPAITDDQPSDAQPAWSPDGALIAFASDRGGQSRDIWVMKPDGSGQTQLTSGTASDRDPAWSPQTRSDGLPGPGGCLVVAP